MNNGGEGPSNNGTGLSREDLMAIVTMVATTLQGLVGPNHNQAPPPPPPARGTKFYYESLRGRNSAVDGTRVKRRRFMDQQMREFRVTSCWFGKPFVEVKRRRFVKLKRCRFAFALKTQQLACAMIKPAGSHNYLESAVARFQQAYYLNITSRSDLKISSEHSSDQISVDWQALIAELSLEARKRIRCGYQIRMDLRYY
ncbi:hypothetical protein F511_17616 [Dorcoceras hygrometricum]|uniref:Uncharacterized protein n=1 Tax=Dorcoceras hygrometricum TaxID=472368 RepID=A0A2Z7B6G5_9LAMI|nr:hypothetical protein F511_17616 [Dorcoceras hygrometricum]